MPYRAIEVLSLSFGGVGNFTEEKGSPFNVVAASQNCEQVLFYSIPSLGALGALCLADQTTPSTPRRSVIARRKSGSTSAIQLEDQDSAGVL